ncbi:MAG: Rieske 2Fe-2S domain-containing protein [Rhodobacteraceae bacterium]|nr:Rieske 2Fe-2S domain-containing protein [Paracoccaceae bacterium]
MTQIDIPSGRFRGHEQQQVWSLAPDPELTEVGPGAPCGEYLRRFWMPVALTQQVTDLPLRLRIMGEDLVLFREKGGKLGLTHLFCRHRNMSLEFGIVEHGGIRCSYHGWKYGLDGEVLETPCEPPSSQVKTKACLGAYPVVEFKGIAFAYMGPPETMPPFPVFDTFDESESEMIPWLIHSPCNWLQVMENAWDPFHTVYLHTKAARVQFTEAFAEMPRIEFFERKLGEFYTNTRRVGDMIWLRIHDKFLPSFTQNGAHFPTGHEQRYFGRCGLTRWVVPVDDTNTVVIAWRHFREGDDPLGLTDRDEVGLGKVDFYGQSAERPYEQRQRDPGDYDAWVSQGPRNIHARENLCFTDRGVAKVRNKLRQAIRNVAQGGGVEQASVVYGGVIPTYGGDTILRIPPIPGADDDQTLRMVAHKVAEIYAAADELRGAEREQRIVADLKAFEASFA